MKPVTDPSLLMELDSGAVTDPALLEELERPEPEAPAPARHDFSDVISTVRSSQGGVVAPGVPDYSGVFRDPEADNDGFGAIALRSLVGRAPEIIANLVELPANANEALTRSLGMTPSDTGVMGRMRGLLRSGAEGVRELGYERDMAQAGYGEPSVSGGQLVEAVNPLSEVGVGERMARVARFVPETLIASAPDMLATLNPMTLAGYMGARTNEIATDRAAADQRDQVTTGDLALGGVAAPIEALLERFTTLRLLPQGTTLGAPGVREALGRIAKEAGLQGGLGGVEELVPYLAERLGTQTGTDPREALESFIGGLVAEGALGGGAQTGKEAINAVRPPGAVSEEFLRATQEAVPREPVPDDDGDIAELLVRNLPSEPVRDAPAEPGAEPDAAPDPYARFRRPEPAPSPASPAVEPSPAPAAAQPFPVRPETPPTREPAEPGAQIQTSPQGGQAPAGQSAPVPAGADLVSEATPEAVPERRGDALEQQRLTELRQKRHAGALAPEEQTELLDLTERDRVSAKVAGRRMRGVLNMEARNEAEAAGTLKPVQGFADADNFKAVNDRLGHEVGDQVIRQMGELFAEQLGEGNVFHRGGDEFVMQADSQEQMDAAMTSVRDTLGRATLRATLENGTVVEQQGVGFSHGAGATIQEAERVQFQDKDARKQAGLRVERDEASRAVPDAGPVRGEPGAAREEAGEDRADPARVAAEKVTGTKNAVTDAERAHEGRDPIVREAARTNQETVDKAVQTLRDNPSRGTEVVERLRSQGVEGVSLDDEAVLLVHKSDLRTKRDAAAAKAADESQPEEARTVALHEYVDLEGQISAIDDATRASGREWGRLGQFRQRMLREDFTLESMERRLRATTGKPLTQEQSAKIKALSDKVAELQQRADALQAKVGNAEALATYDDLLKSMQNALRGPRKRPTLERLRDAADESRAALASLQSVPRRKQQSGAAINPVAFYHLSRIGAYHVANGLTKLADWTARMRVELGERFDEFREMLPAVFQASKEQAQARLEAGQSVDDALAKIDPAKGPQPKDVRALAEAHIRAGLRGEESVLSAVASSLDMDEADVRKLFVASDHKRAQPLDAVRAELRDLRAVVRLQQEIDRLEAGQPKPAKGQKSTPSQAVAEKRAELEQVRKRLREAARPDPETRYQELRGRDLQRRIEELQARIARGDVAKAPPRVPRALNAANERAQFELAKAKEEFLRLQFEAQLRARSPLAKVFGGVGQVFNLARSIMTSFDLSGVLRQGGFITFGHPVRALRGLGPSLRAFISAQSEHTTKAEILARPNAPQYKKYGLELTGIGGGPLTQIEEAYASRWLERIPGALGGGLVRGSGRSYTTFLNRLRADSFDAMAAALGKTEKLTEAEGKAIANFINVATGRGKIGTSENAGEALNTVFFAPRLVASRFQLLSGQPLYGGSSRTRKLIVQEYARFMLGVGITIALTAFALGGEEEGDKPLVGLDPRSADFLKVRLGKTYLDPLAGLAQVSVLLSRLATGETVTGGGAVKPLRPDYTLTDLRRALGEDLSAHKLSKTGELPFGGGSSADVIGRFLRSKLAPVPGAIVNTLTGSNMIGEPVTPAQAAGELVTPMSFQSIGDVMEEHGVPKGTTITLLGLLGMGVQHRGDRPGAAARDALKVVDAAKSDIEDTLVAIPVARWESEFAKMKAKHAPLLNGVELDMYEKDGKYGKAGEPRMTADGRPVLAFEGKDGAGSVMGELEGYPGFGASGPYTTDGARDRMKALDRMANVLGGDQTLSNDAAIRLTERVQLQLPAATELYDTVQREGSGEAAVPRKTRDTLLEQVRFLRQAEEQASADVVRAAQDGTAPEHNAVNTRVRKAIEDRYTPRPSSLPEARRAEYVGIGKGGRATPAPAVLKGAKNAPKLVMVGNWKDLPNEGVKRQLENGAVGVYDPAEKKAYVVMGLDEAEAKFVAYHEIAGHHGLRGALGDDYESVLNRARQNPTVAKLADVMGRDAYKGAYLLDRTEEALSELAAARKADDYERIESTWGIKVPASAQSGVRGMVSRVVQLTKRKLADLVGEEPDAYDDEQVYSLIEDAWQYVERGPTRKDAPNPTARREAR